MWVSFEDGLLQALDLAAWNQRYPWALESVLLEVLFVGLAKVSLGKRFSGRGGAAVVVAVGTALAIGAESLAYATHFSFSQLGAPAWIAVLILVGSLLYDLVRSAGISRVPAVAVAVLLIAGTLNATGVLNQWLVASGLAPLVGLASLAALLTLAWSIASKFEWPARTRLPVKDAGPTDTNESDPVRDDVRVAEEVATSLLELIRRLTEHVKSRGIDQQTISWLQEITRRERMVAAQYARVLKTVAGLNARSTPVSTEHLHRCKQALLAAHDNIAAFDRAVTLAKAAAGAGNAELLLRSLGHMLALEENGFRLIRLMRSCLEQLLRTPSSTNRPALAPTR